VTNFAKRQERVSNAEKQKRYRERNKVVTRSNENVTHGNADTDTDTDTDTERGNAVALYTEVTGNYPGKSREKIVIERLGENPDRDTLGKAYRLWIGRGYSSINLDGILDYYNNLLKDSAWSPNGGGRSFDGPTDDDIWQVVLDHARRGDAKFDNPRIKQAVKKYGWRKLQNIPPGKEGFCKGDFMEVYRGTPERA
jgi:hypothetical protein